VITNDSRIPITVNISKLGYNNFSTTLNLNNTKNLNVNLNTGGFSSLKPEYLMYIAIFIIILLILIFVLFYLIRFKHVANIRLKK